MRTIRECIDYGSSIGVNRADGNDSMRWRLTMVVPLLIALAACEGPEGPQGAQGDVGPETRWHLHQHAQDVCHRNPHSPGF